VKEERRVEIEPPCYPATLGGVALIDPRRRDRRRRSRRVHADEIGRLRNTLRNALAATDFVWSKQLIRLALNEQEKHS
jgi:hypothetical protein